jgi:tRNA (guanine-N7-)-methyltransferase
MLKKEPLSNLKITNQDARIFIDNFPDNFFEKIFILFPDPWPKYKHFKRRLIDKNFLDQILFPKLKNAGKVIIATDHDSYKTWILSHILQSSKFNWLANSKKSWQNFPHDWIITKYQKKAILEGREPILIEIEKS